MIKLLLTEVEWNVRLHKCVSVSIHFSIRFYSMFAILFDSHIRTFLLSALSLYSLEILSRSMRDAVLFRGYINCSVSNLKQNQCKIKDPLQIDKNLQASCRICVIVVGSSLNSLEFDLVIVFVHCRFFCVANLFAWWHYNWYTIFTYCHRLFCFNLMRVFCLKYSGREYFFFFSFWFDLEANVLAELSGRARCYYNVFKWYRTI